MNTKISAKKITTTSVYLALIAILMFMPLLGFMSFVPGGTAGAVLFLVIIVLAAELEGLWTGVICSTFFGICSFINSYIKWTMTAFIFQNPLNSILPRVFIGFSVYFAFKLFKKLFKKNDGKFLKIILPSALGAAAGVITNTALVLTLMGLGYGNVALTLENGALFGSTVLQLIFGTILIMNFPVELLGCILIVPPVYYAISKYRKMETALQHQTAIVQQMREAETAEQSQAEGENGEEEKI